MIAVKECHIGKVEIYLLDNNEVVFRVPDGGDTDQLMEHLFALPEDIARQVVSLSILPGTGAAHFAEYEQISRDPRIANVGKLRLLKGGAS